MFSKANFTLKSLFLLICFSLGFFPLTAQDCTTETTEASVQAFENNSIQLVTANAIQGFVDIPIKAWLIGRSNGSGRLSTTALNQAIRDANRHFEQTRLRFFLCETENINSNYYYDYTKSKENNLTRSYSKADVINVYFTDMTGSCGYAYFPSAGKDVILMDNGCTSNGSTFSHELGHYFGLFHTHETRRGKELVNGNNCSTAGDLICDTPADPVLSNKVNSSCNYTGTERDANNHRYRPNERNLMSYSRKNCRSQFSEGQIGRIVTTYFLDRYYLSCGNTPGCDAIPISCGDFISGTTVDGTNDFERSDYANCHSTSSSFNGKDKLYVVNVDSRSTLRVRLTGLSRDLDIFVMDDCSAGRCIGKSTRSNQSSEEVVIPNALGTYYIVVDGYTSSAQSSFNLEVLCGNSTPARPDFYISNASVSDNTVSTGQTISASCRQNVTNPTTSYNVNMAYVLSTNTSYGPSDIILSTDVSSLSSGDRWDGESASLRIPSNLSSGTWYVLFVADYQNQFTESNENNNVDWIRITVNGSSGGSCIISDDFDRFSTNSNISSVNPNLWRKWSSSAPDGKVSRDVAKSGSRSLEINRGQFGRQDVVLKLGNRTRGIYKVSWDMYINDRDQAYFNVQNSQNNLVSGGAFQITIEDTDRDLQNKWFNVELYVDLNSNRLRLYLDNRRYRFNRTYTANLGGINFYAIADAHFYVDNVCLQSVNSFPFVSGEDNTASGRSRNDNTSTFSFDDVIKTKTTQSADLTVFPNPTTSTTNLVMDLQTEENLQLTVMNTTGQVIKQISLGKTNRINETIDLSNYASGIYFAKVVGETVNVTKRIILQ